MTAALARRNPTASASAKLPGLQALRLADPQAQKAFEALREWVEVRLGTRGDPWERAVTFRDLFNAGIIDATGTATGTAGTVTNSSTTVVTNVTSGGITNQTFPDIASIITALAGKITSSELYAALGDRINLIDAPITGLVARMGTVVGTATDAATNLVATESLTRKNADDSLYAQYTVKIDQNGYVSGYGLASTLKDAVADSIFLVRANTFAIASPSGPGIAPIVPFMVQTTPTTINGVAVPVGVYMDAAFILNGSITNAKIANLDAGKINAGSLAVGRFITSQNYVAGVSGWAIFADGTAEFGMASIRGVISANSLLVGASPAISGSTMTGSGATIQPDGTFALGNSATSIVFNGVDPITINGPVVATGNLQLNSASSMSSAYVQNIAGSAIEVSLVHAATSGEIIILASGNIQNNGPQNGVITAEVYRGSTYIAGALVGYIEGSDRLQYGGNVRSFSIVCVDAPQTQNTTYRVAILNGAGQIECNNLSLIILERKR